MPLPAPRSSWGSFSYCESPGKGSGLNSTVFTVLCSVAASGLLGTCYSRSHQGFLGGGWTRLEASATFCWSFIQVICQPPKPGMTKSSVPTPVDNSLPTSAPGVACSSVAIAMLSFVVAVEMKPKNACKSHKRFVWVGNGSTCFGFFYSSLCPARPELLLWVWMDVIL